MYELLKSLQSSPITWVTLDKVTDSLPSITQATIKCQQRRCYWKTVRIWARIHCHIIDARLDRTKLQIKGLERQIRSYLDTQIKFQHSIDVQSWAEKDIKQETCQMKREPIITSLHSFSNKEGRVRTAQMWKRKWGLDISNSLWLKLRIKPLFPNLFYNRRHLEHWFKPF